MNDRYRAIRAVCGPWSWRGPLAAAWVVAAVGMPTSALAVQDGVPQPEPARAQPEAQPESRPAQAAGVQPVAPAGDPLDEEIVFPAAAEPIQLLEIVRFAVEVLELNAAVDPSLQGAVALNTPLRLKKSNLLPVVNVLLEQRGFVMTQEPLTGIYEVRPATAVGVSFEGPLATTRVIPTPNVKPSALQQVISAQLTVSPRLSYLDNLGVIVVTGTPRQVDAVERFVARVLSERERMQLIRFDLEYLSAATALQRVVELAGAVRQQTQQPGFDPRMGQQPQQPATPGTGSLENIADRLIVSPHGNALIFRGLPAESAEIERLLQLVDRPDELSSKRYFTGSSTGQIADLAEQMGLGDVVRLRSESIGEEFLFGMPGGMQPQRQRTTTVGGSRLVVDEQRGYISYYGTASQQEQLAKLIEEFKTEGEIPVVVVYKLRHGDAEKMAELIQGLIEGQIGAAQNPLLPQLPGGAGRRQPVFTPTGEFFGMTEEGGTEGTFTGGQDVFVIADVSNNQLVVRAPKRQQDEFARLIEKLDLRRPQVFIQAQIVAITTSQDFRLAFESQLVSGQFAVNTDFDLSSFAENALITAPKVVATGLPGVTAALVKSKYVPFIINALQVNASGRVLASPQLLVDDNEEAEVISVDRRPFAQISQGQNTTITSQGGVAEAGTTFTVTPRISDGGYLNMKFALELSTFTGESAGEGLQPPSQVNNLRAESVLVPSDMTIVVGGLTLDTVRDSIIKIPLLGDIPLIGHLFRDTRRSGQTTVLYVFISPRIMRDPNFLDMALITAGPQREVALDPDIPDIKPKRVELFETAARNPAAMQPAGQGG